MYGLVDTTAEADEYTQADGKASEYKAYVSSKQTEEVWEQKIPRLG